MQNTLDLEFVPFQKDLRDTRKHIFQSHGLEVPSQDDRDGRSVVKQLVCRIDDEIVGMARWQVDQWGYKIDYFGVEKRFCGQGIGKIIIQRIIQDVKSSGEGNLQVYCQAPNQTENFFSRLGFKKRGEHFWKHNELCTFFCLTNY